MATFATTPSPTSFGFFDNDSTFQTEADSIVRFVKRKLGDSTISVELTNKDVWTCFEEATLEYGKHIANNVIKSNLTNYMGVSTSSLGDVTNKYPRSSLEYLMRMAEPYADLIGRAGSFDSIMGYIDLVSGQQEYDFYSSLKTLSGSLVVDTIPENQRGKLRVLEVYHFDPVAGRSQLLDGANITQFLANQFNYETYVNSTAFYVLPVYEDVLRRGMIEEAVKVRRSHYTYQLDGRKIRILPLPDASSPYHPTRLWIRVSPPRNPLEPAYEDSSLSGSVTGPHNVPFNNLPYSTINAPGRQWIREYTLMLCKELLGLIRSKFSSIPIPEDELKLDGSELIGAAKEEKEKLLTELKEMLSELTQAKLAETAATAAKSMQEQLRLVPFRYPIRLG